MNTENSLSIEEKKEKIILELNYILSNFEEPKMKENKKNLAKIISEISEIFETNISSKMIKDFIHLKESNLNENLIRLSKYLQ